MAAFGLIGSFVVPHTRATAERNAKVTTVQNPAPVSALSHASPASLSGGILDAERVNAKLLATPDYGLLPIEETRSDFWGTAKGFSEQVPSLGLPVLGRSLLRRLPNRPARLKRS